MFERISSCFNTSLTGVFAVGDSQRDLQAAVAAGAQPVLVLTGKGETTRTENDLPEGTLVFADLTAVAEHLLHS
jgi:D-glycero-D-manno-heptose 1,7-bisphosphate phosphatase